MKVAQECNSKYTMCKVVAVQTDVTKEEECKLEEIYLNYNRVLIDTAIKVFGRIDILILNAGAIAYSYFEDMKDMSTLK